VYFLLFNICHLFLLVIYTFFYSVCGDWFTPSSSSTGPSIESAYLSGRFLADAIAERFQSTVIKDYGLELHHSFEACAGHPLGDVPTGAGTSSQTSKYAYSMRKSIVF
jgi:hypothetical protein